MLELLHYCIPKYTGITIKKNEIFPYSKIKYNNFEMLAILKGFSKFSNNSNMILIENLFKNLKCLND